MDSKDDSNSTPLDSGLNRRHFIAALGATAASATLLQQFAKADESTVMYQDSFGNIVPVAEDVLSLGIVPPPFPKEDPPQSPDAFRGHSRGSHFEAHLEDDSGGDGAPSQPNFLMILVDQLRAPRWLPTGVSVDTLLPNISYLRDHSFSFNNYFVAATACTPSRATLLTGLYSQQTCMFKTQESVSQAPSLNPDYQNIAKVLSTSPRLSSPYQCYWVGKWHLSDPAPSLPGSSPGADGPSDYGFSTTPGSMLLQSPTFPPNSSYASPNGVGNLGTEGYNPSGNHPPNINYPGTTSAPPYLFYDDAAIGDWFTGNTLPLLNTSSQPWFAAVSFMNPHDITAFPFAYQLTPTANVFAAPTYTGGRSYPTPDPAGNLSGFPDTYLPALNTVYTNSSAPTNWNYYDNPYGQIYNTTTQTGKPGLQLAFQQYIDNQDGAVLGYNSSSPTASGKTGWLEFMNYYYWMQSCVDSQIGNVLKTLYDNTSSGVWQNTIVLFLSDHGDYGGSHWLHAKAGALYDESINVPLYISFGAQRPTAPPGLTGTYTPNTAYALNRTFVCSSVDILPFLYAAALGNDFGWRSIGSDNIRYLSGRESILDAIFAPNTVAQRRVAPGIAYANAPYHNQTYQPYVLHTTDEDRFNFYNVGAGNVYVPMHAIAFRTVDLTINQTNPDGFNVQGGGKLGMYSYWDLSNTFAPTQPETANQQYEFYDYTGGNIGELNNEYWTKPLKFSLYNSAYSAIAQGELYNVYAQFNSIYKTALLNYLATE